MIPVMGVVSGLFAFGLARKGFSFVADDHVARAALRLLQRLLLDWSWWQWGTLRFVTLASILGVILAVCAVVASPRSEESWLWLTLAVTVFVNCAVAIIRRTIAWRRRRAAENGGRKDNEGMSHKQ